MTFKMPSLIAAATILALAPTAQAAEPVTLDDTQLDAVTAGALPDIIIWDIDGGDGPGGPAGSNPGTGLDDILWDIDGDETYATLFGTSFGGGGGSGGAAGSSAGSGFGGSPYTLSALPDIVIWDIDGGDGPGGPAGSSGTFSGGFVFNLK